MGRIMGLDYGQKRIGIAVSDALHLIASPLKTIIFPEIIQFLQQYTAKESVETIVVGWPLQLNGEESAATRSVTKFVRLLKRYFSSIPIITYDERFTSVIAQKSLLQRGISKTKRQEKGQLDAISATFILRSFMEKKQWLERCNKAVF